MAKDSRTTDRSTSQAPARRRRLPGTHLRSAEPFAVTTDGSVYINIDALEAIDTAQLKDRKLFIGAELGPGERHLAEELLNNAGHELAAKIAGPLTRRRTPKPT
ncbi:MAG: hypothetical protein HUU21_24695 [Polyangiaceae bacterium]|nr:hypothetical protein [Polyangiaceae bacterium]